MYQAFDPFLIRSTWSTGHALDIQAFNNALNAVVDHPNFHADDMGQYMYNAKNVTVGSGHPDEQAIESLVASAHAIHDFLIATKR